MKKNIVIKYVEQALRPNSQPKITSFKQRKFSLIYELVVDGKTFILKIPKEEGRVKNFQEHISKKETKEKAVMEWESLNYFYEITKSELCPISFVRPVAYIMELNAIVTEKIAGEDFYKLLRKDSSKSAKKANEDIVKKIGRGFAYIHRAQDSKKKAIVNFNLKSVDDEKLDKTILELFKKYEGRFSAITKSMSGFDIRDIIVDQKNDIFFVDPGQLTEKSIYYILANFLATTKIIHQGTWKFPFRTIDKAYEKYFLSGYFGDGKYDKKLLGLFTLAILTILYNSAKKKSNNTSRNIPFFRDIIKKLYINPFYYREISKTIEEYGL